MANYTIDPSILKPLLPTGTELDFHQGETFVSMVGFRFLNTRIAGIAFPLHTNFEEVNLRFYVRRPTPDGFRRGVVFIRELVPRSAIAFLARTFYGEPYTALPMSHSVTRSANGLVATYGWSRSGTPERLCVEASETATPAPPGSLDEFITEHYWGYTARNHHANEYEVEHPRWQIHPGTTATLNADITPLYGARFEHCLNQPPASCFIASGSPVQVRYPTRIRAN